MALPDRPHSNDCPFLKGSGEMARLTRSFPWYNTILGDPAGWPQSLKTITGVILNSRFPMFLWWGTELTCFYNDAYRPSLGDQGKHPAILGMPAREAWPEIWDTIKPLIDQVLDGGESVWNEDMLLPIYRNGKMEDVYWTFSYSPVIDETGNPAGVLVTCMETTEKVTLVNDLETALEVNIVAGKRTRESEDTMRSLVASAPFPIAVYEGREMRVALANQSIIDVWGKGPDVINKQYKDILPELANQNIFAQLDNVFTTGIPFHARDQRVDLVINDQLQSFYFNYSFTPLFNRLGEIYGVMNTAAEVTDLHVARQKVEQNEKNLHSMILQAPVAMCILLGPDHIITVANELMVRLWGKPVNDVMYKPVFDALPDARGQGLEAVMAKVFENGEPFVANEVPVSLVRNGVQEIVYQNFVYVPYRDSDDRILGVIAITIDVTGQVLSRMQLQTSEAELLEIKQRLEQELEAGKQLQRQKDDFIGMASHELKTPLTSLTAIMQVLQRTLKESENQFISGALDKANLQVKRMTYMINSFLNISRLESGKILIEKQPFFLDQLLADIVDETKLTVTSHTIHLSSPDGVKIYADHDKISSVISNLISNAVKYSPAGTTIDMKCQVTGQQVQVYVRDAGMGIDPQDLAQIFERYYRVETSRTQHIAGFGIGLYLCAEIIHRHEGLIWVESEPDKGSTFYFSLPSGL